MPKKGTGILNLSAAIEKIRLLLATDGFSIIESTNFKKFRKEVEKLPGKSLTEQASLEFFDLTDHNAFWIGIYDKEGQCISLQAARIDDLGSSNLADYWRIQQPRIYAKPNKIGKEHAPTAFKIKGTVLYHGDFYWHPEYRGTGYSGIIILLGFFVGQAHYNPDWVYGLMNSRLAQSRFPNQAGYAIQEPRGTHWLMEPEGISGQDWLVASRRSNIHHIATVIADEGIDEFLGKRKDALQ